MTTHFTIDQLISCIFTYPFYDGEHEPKGTPQNLQQSFVSTADPTSPRAKHMLTGEQITENMDVMGLNDEQTKDIMQSFIAINKALLKRQHMSENSNNSDLVKLRWNRNSLLGVKQTDAQHTYTYTEQYIADLKATFVLDIQNSLENNPDLLKKTRILHHPAHDHS